MNPEKEISGSLGTFRHSGATTIALTLLAGRFNAPTATWLSASVIAEKRAPKTLHLRGVLLQSHSIWTVSIMINAGRLSATGVDYSSYLVHCLKQTGEKEEKLQ